MTVQYPLNPSVNVVNNARCLAKMQNKKLGDVEQALNFSTGYLSRAGKGHKYLSIDLCCRIAEYFQISIEDLCSKNLTMELRKETLKQEIERLQKELEECDKES